MNLPRGPLQKDPRVSRAPSSGHGLAADEVGRAHIASVRGRWVEEFVTVTWNVNGGSSISAHSGSAENITVSGVRANDKVMFAGSTSGANYLLMRAEADPPSAGSVRMHFFNTNSSSQTPGSITIQLRVIHRSIPS